MFELRSKKAPQVAVKFIQLLSENLYDHKKAILSSVTDYHFSQLFFTVGHFSLKMLTFFDDQEDLAKKIIGSGGDEFDADKELEEICGGKEAEIESALEEIAKLRENEIIQNGIIGDYLPLMI